LNNYFITGCTGFVGGNVLLDLLNAHPVDFTHSLYCLVRAKDCADRVIRIINSLNCARISRGMTPILALPSCVVPVVGDMDSIATILNSDLISNDFVVIHVAALLSFDPKDESQINITNVICLRSLLIAAGRMRLAGFLFVSTAFSCGTKTGIIEQILHTDAADFNNAYEKSKRDGELMVSEWCQLKSVPYKIVRPSVVMGNSRTYDNCGSSDSYYGLISRMSRFAARANSDAPYKLYCGAGVAVDLVPVDHVSHVIVSEAIRIDSDLKIIHAASGCRFSSDSLLEFINAAIGRRIISPCVTADVDLSPIEVAINNGAEIYKPYMFQDKDFLVEAEYRLNLTPEDVRSWVKFYIDKFVSPALQVNAA
jgi:nucleoside-diphosphate-sugar epimerase